MSINKVSIIGLGALGILFGQHLSKRMPKENLRIVANEERIKRYQHDGVYCNGERCDFHYVSPDHVCEPADLILFTVKASGLNNAIDAVKHHVGENTIIISALNGIKSEEIIGQTYGLDKLLYSVAQGMDAVKVENHLTYDHKGLLCFGDREPGYISDKVKRVSEFFDATEFPYEIDIDMMKRQWGKFMLNVGVNQTVAVFETNYGGIQQQGNQRDMMISAMQEVIPLSQKEGIDLTEEDLNYWLRILNTLSPEGKPSMRQDLEAQRYSEVELFAGTVIQLGEKYDVPTPINKDLYNRIKEIECHF